MAENARLEQQRKFAEAEAEVNRLEEVLERLNKALRGTASKTTCRRASTTADWSSAWCRGTSCSRPTSRACRVAASEVIDTLAPVLKDIPDQLQIDGHTDQVKVKPSQLPHRLGALRRPRRHRAAPPRGEWRIPDERMTASAFGHERPLVDPSKPGSQAINKRVDIVILTALPAETRELINEVVEPGQGEQS